MKTIFWSLEQFSYDLEMKTREQNKNNKRAKIKRFDWFIERIQTHLWLVKRTLCWKNFMPEELSRNRFDVILQHDWSMEQCLLHIRVFFGGKMKSPWFVLFIHWLIKQITLTESIFQGHTKIALCKGNPLTLESEGLGNPEWIILYSTRSVYFRKLTTRYS